MGVHFEDVEWLGIIRGVRGMEVGQVCAVSGVVVGGKSSVHGSAF